jgi:hypothetical protein
MVGTISSVLTRLTAQNDLHSKTHLRTSLDEKLDWRMHLKLKNKALLRPKKSLPSTIQQTSPIASYDSSSQSPLSPQFQHRWPVRTTAHHRVSLSQWFGPFLRSSLVWQMRTQTLQTQRLLPQHCYLSLRERMCPISTSLILLHMTGIDLQQPDNLHLLHRGVLACLPKH